MVIALPRLQTATTKRCENASASVKHNYRSLPVGPRLVRVIDVSTYEGADFMGDRLRHVGSAVPRTSGLAEPDILETRGRRHGARDMGQETWDTGQLET